MDLQLDAFTNNPKNALTDNIQYLLKILAEDETKEEEIRALAITTLHNIEEERKRITEDALQWKEELDEIIPPLHKQT